MISPVTIEAKAGINAGIVALARIGGVSKSPRPSANGAARAANEKADDEPPPPPRGPPEMDEWMLDVNDWDIEPSRSSP